MIRVGLRVGCTRRPLQIILGECFEVVNIVEHVHVGPTVDNLLCLCVELRVSQHVVFQQALQHFFYEPYHNVPKCHPCGVPWAD